MGHIGDCIYRIKEEIQMKAFKSIVMGISIALVGFVGVSVSADDSEEKHVMVEIHKLSDSNSLVDLSVNGQAETFNLPDLKVGETKEIETESGSIISVTKTESGVSILINGEEVNLPAVGSDMSAHFVKAGNTLHRNTSDDIQVVGDLTEGQIAIIRDAFAAAGVDKEVSFSKGNEMHFITVDDGSFDIKMDGLHETFDIEVDGNDVKKWISKDGKNVKIIKIGDAGDERLHIQHKVIVIEKTEEN